MVRAFTNPPKNKIHLKFPLGVGGGGLVESNFQLLMLSPNLLKSKIPMLRVGREGGGVGVNQFPTFDAESKFAKIQNSHVEGGGGGRLVETNFQLLMLSSNLLKSKILMLRVGGWVVGGVSVNQFPTFDAESKFAKIQNFHVEGGWVGGGSVESNFQLLMLSPNLLKSQIPMLRMSGGLVESNFQLLMLSSNLLKSKTPMLRVGRWVGGYGGGLVETNFQLLILSSNLLKSKIPMLRVGGWGVGGN